MGRTKKGIKDAGFYNTGQGDIFKPVLGKGIDMKKASKAFS
ncbi:MAG: hypothetical protein WDM78_14305 [Puia sp.]